MKKKSFLVPLLLCLSIFGNSHPGLADSLIPADLLDRLESEGWQQVSPGVLQRAQEGGAVETLGFGSAGLRFKIEQAKEFLAFLRKENARNPSRETRRAIRAYRAEIRHAQAALKDADRTLESSSEALIAAGVNCVSNYDASAEAFALSQQGAGARASADFKSGCSEDGEVYAFAYATAKSADGSTISTQEKHDAAAPDVPRIGNNVTAKASVTVKGKQACFSRARATVTIYNPAIAWQVVDENRTCDGHPDVRPFALRAASNVLLPASPAVDPNSAAMVANLNRGQHQANLYAYGKPVYDASTGTPLKVICTEPWGTCPLSLQPVPIHPSWKPSSGEYPLLSVIDYTNGKIYDFYRVVTNPDGTVKINADGTVTTGWGRISDLDGNGQASASNLSDLFGLTRVFEMERAASDPANAIQHALVFRSQYACSTYRYPALQSNGTFSGTSCIPAGSRIFLDKSADCSTVAPVGERAVCYALQKYGAYAIGIAGSPFSIVFEAPSGGQFGGSAPDPYPGVGLGWDYYDMTRIPWSQLKVAPDCQCTPY